MNSILSGSGLCWGNKICNSLFKFWTWAKSGNEIFFCSTRHDGDQRKATHAAVIYQHYKEVVIFSFHENNKSKNKALNWIEFENIVDILQ